MVHAVLCDRTMIKSEKATDAITLVLHGRGSFQFFLVFKTLILLLFCLHRMFIFDNRSTGEAQQSLFDFVNSVAMCLAEFI